MKKLCSVLIATAAIMGCATTGGGREGPALSAGEFVRIYDPNSDAPEGQVWYINDHCFIRGRDGTWHMFGITNFMPVRPLEEDQLAHATAPDLTNQSWKSEPFALTVDPRLGEVHLWAPHVIEHDGVYYMFYCAGDEDHRAYRIHLATSEDLVTWTRHAGNPLFQDGFDARDPYIFRHGNQWILYYTATEKPEGGRYIVAYRTSRDLVHWSERAVAYVDEKTGTYGGPTESPTVIRRGDRYYLFIGPRGGYVGTEILVSDSPYHWELADKVGRIESHAAEVVRDENGKWFVSHCGWGMGGVYLAPLQWHDGFDEDI